jgi:hypothetical protein
MTESVPATKEIDALLAALPEVRPTFQGERPSCIDENGEPNTGHWNAGSEYDSLRAPEGFEFTFNLSLNSDLMIERFKKYQADPTNYVLMRNAYDSNGRRLKNSVAVFKKKS